MWWLVALKGIGIRYVLLIIIRFCINLQIYVTSVLILLGNWEWCRSQWTTEPTQCVGHVCRGPLCSMFCCWAHTGEGCVAATLSPCDPPALISHFRDLSFLFVLAGLSPVWRSTEKPGHAEWRGGNGSVRLPECQWVRPRKVGQAEKFSHVTESKEDLWGGSSEAALMLQGLFMSMCRPLSQISVNSVAYCSQGAENMTLSPCIWATAALFVNKGHSLLSGKMWLKLEMSGTLSLFVYLTPSRLSSVSVLFIEYFYIFG